MQGVDELDGLELPDAASSSACSFFFLFVLRLRKCGCVISSCFFLFGVLPDEIEFFGFLPVLDTSSFFLPVLVTPVFFSLSSFFFGTLPILTR